MYALCLRLSGTCGIFVYRTWVHEVPERMTGVGPITVNTEILTHPVALESDMRIGGMHQLVCSGRGCARAF